MDPVAEDSSTSVPEEVGDFCEGEPPHRGTYYSVYVPPDVRPKGTQIFDYIYKDRVAAMKTVKKAKKARFKHFESFQEALKFATVGIVELPRLGAQQVNGSAKGPGLGPQVGNEKLSPFKGPKPQDLVKLRKAIETGDVDAFRQAVWENPRYLVSSGDTPSILQEGFRYNALHVAAKAKNGVLAEMILNTISNPAFVTLLYGDDQNENVETRIQVLLDLYLNTPDKGLNETPLHFASKFGAVDVVEVLVSFPECDKSLKNKYGQTAEMIICDRCDNKDKTGALKKKIALHFANFYYVPVLRAEDDSMPAVVGEPFSPGKSPVIRTDPLSPRYEIHAFAGPMNREGAQEFRKVWKTPPRTSTPIKRRRIDHCLESVAALRFTDPSKGLERMGQKLASKFDVSWKEYWSFLDCFIDVSSDEGLILLEDYLATRIAVADGHHQAHNCPTPDGSKRAMSTIADLCAQMQNCNLNDSCEEDGDFNSFLCVEKACNVFANRIATEIYHRIFEDFQLQVTLLEMQTKQVELLILSYMDDFRFNKVNFAQLHPRLGLLTGQKLCYFITKDYRADYVKSLNRFVTECVRAFDCFSSDDEGNYPKENKPTSSKKQLICLVQNILNSFNQNTEPHLELDEEDVCRDAWTKTKECTCVFHFKRVRKSMGLSRNNSSKHSFKGLRKRLSFAEKDAKIDDYVIEDSSSDEEFFTPPGSPSQLCDSDNEDDFSDAPLLSEVFLEGGDSPTKTDCALFKALRFADCQIKPEKYPNIYRWYHNVGLYSDSERESWRRPKTKPTHQSEACATPPRHLNSKVSHGSPSSTSWLRITGANSPRTSLQNKFNV